MTRMTCSSDGEYLNISPPSLPLSHCIRGGQWTPSSVTPLLLRIAIAFAYVGSHDHETGEAGPCTTLGQKLTSSC